MTASLLGGPKINNVIWSLDHMLMAHSEPALSLEVVNQTGDLLRPGQGYLDQSSFFFFFFFVFLGLHLQHTEFPRLGVELQLPVYTTATATQDLSRV